MEKTSRATSPRHDGRGVDEYDRLESLSAIQTVLAQPIGIEHDCDTLLTIVARVLRVRTAVLLETTRELDRTFTWAAAGVAQAEVEEARDHARETFSYFALPPGHVAEPGAAARRFVALPLSLLHGHVLGVFQLEPALAFDERDLLYINLVADQLAIALERHHARHVNRRLRDLEEISKAALEGATLDESLSAVLSALCAMFTTDTAAVLRASADGKMLRNQASIGLNGARDAEVSVGSGFTGRIAAADTAMLFEDYDDREDVNPILRSNGIRSLLGAPMRARGHLTGVVCVASRDRRKFSHDKLQLLELVADRIGTIIDTATLYEQALAAIRSRDVVMGIVSHDLRNPLSAIQMCTELFADDDPQVIRPVSIIKRSVDVMSRLISDLRDVGSIEAGHLSIKTRSEDARALVRDAVEECQDAAAKKGVRLDASPPTRELALDCDRIRIIQVVTNLVSNAIKFTPPGGSITIATADAAPGYAQLYVEDTGTGIQDVDLPHVFDRYWQAKDTAHLGTGLGLAIAKGIVEAHGGTMSVERRVDRGTRFSFTVPLARDSTERLLKPSTNCCVDRVNPASQHR